MHQNIQMSKVVAANHAFPLAYGLQGLWRIEYLNAGRASSPKIWLFNLLPVVAQVGVFENAFLHFYS